MTIKKANPKESAIKPNHNYIGFGAVRVAAQGQWLHIHSRLGANVPSANHRKHTPCPACGGRDRFRVLPDYHETGRWYCGGGGDPQSGDGFALLGHIYGWSPRDQLKAVAEVLGLDRADTKTRKHLSAQAKQQRQDIAAMAQRKDERSRLDSNVISALCELEDAINRRKHCTQITQMMWLPTQEERALAQSLNASLLEAYAGQEVQHDQ